MQPASAVDRFRSAGVDGDACKIAIAIGTGRVSSPNRLNVPAAGLRHFGQSPGGGDAQFRMRADSHMGLRKAGNVIVGNSGDHDRNAKIARNVAYDGAESRSMEAAEDVFDSSPDTGEIDARRVLEIVEEVVYGIAPKMALRKSTGPPVIGKLGQRPRIAFDQFA